MANNKNRYLVFILSFLILSCSGQNQSSDKSASISDLPETTGSSTGSDLPGSDADLPADGEFDDGVAVNIGAAETNDGLSGDATTIPADTTGGDDSVTPPADTTGGDDSVTPPADTTGGDDSVTPPADTTGGDDSVTPPADTTGGDDSVTPPADTTGDDDSVTPPADTTDDNDSAEPRDETTGGGDVEETTGGDEPAADRDEVVDHDETESFPIIGFDHTTATILESAGTKSIHVSLSAASTVPVVVQYSVTSASSIDKSDVAAVRSLGEEKDETDLSTDIEDDSLFSGVLTIPAGAISGKINVVISDDKIGEADENIVLKLSSAENAILDSSSTTLSPTITLVVKDNDSTKLKLSHTGGSSIVYEEFAGDSYRDDEITVELTSQPTQDVHVNLKVNDQITIDNTSLIFTAADWNVPQTISVNSVDDHFLEKTGSSFGVVAATTMSNDSAFEGLSKSLKVYVIDDDTPGLAISSDDLTVREGAMTTYTVALTSEPKANVAVALSSALSKVISVSPNLLVFSPTDWSSPQTVKVMASDNSVAATQCTKINHAIKTAEVAYKSVKDETIDVCTQEDDVVGVSIQQTDDETIVTKDGHGDSYTLALTSKPTADVTVSLYPYTTGAFSFATTAGDELTSVTFNSSNWHTAQRVVVKLLSTATSLKDGDEITLDHTTKSSDPAYNGLDLDPITVEIADTEKSSDADSEIDLSDLSWNAAAGLNGFMVENLADGDGEKCANLQVNSPVNQISNSVSITDTKINRTTGTMTATYKNDIMYAHSGLDDDGSKIKGLGYNYKTQATMIAAKQSAIHFYPLHITVDCSSGGCDAIGTGVMLDSTEVVSVDENLGDGSDYAVTAFLSGIKYDNQREYQAGTSSDYFDASFDITSVTITGEHEVSVQVHTRAGEWDKFQGRADLTVMVYDPSRVAVRDFSQADENPFLFTADKIGFEPEVTYNCPSDTECNSVPVWTAMTGFNTYQSSTQSFRLHKLNILQRAEQFTKSVESPGDYEVKYSYNGKAKQLACDYEDSSKASDKAIDSEVSVDAIFVVCSDASVCQATYSEIQNGKVASGDGGSKQSLSGTVEITGLETKTTKRLP